jgi:hypothetical protein
MTEYAHGHPINDKAALAEWMKYPSEAAMDADHDNIHEILCLAFNKLSYSKIVAMGKERLTEEERHLAACEEAAVLHVQRWWQWMRVYEQGKRP